MTNKTMEKDLDYYKDWYTLRDGDFFPERVEDVILKRTRGRDIYYLQLLIEADNIFPTRKEALWASKQIRAFLSNVQRQSSAKLQHLQAPSASQAREPQEPSNQHQNHSANTCERKQQSAPYRKGSEIQEHCSGMLLIKIFHP